MQEVLRLRTPSLDGQDRLSDGVESWSLGQPTSRPILASETDQGSGAPEAIKQRLYLFDFTGELKNLKDIVLTFVLTLRMVVS